MVISFQLCCLKIPHSCIGLVITEWGSKNVRQTFDLLVNTKLIAKASQFVSAAASKILQLLIFGGCTREIARLGSGDVMHCLVSYVSTDTWPKG